MSRYILAITLLLFLATICMGEQSNFPENSSHGHENQITAKSLPANYQQLKHRMLRLDSKQNGFQFPGSFDQSDLTMLYVSGGLLLATSTFVFLNGYKSEEGYFSRSNAGVIIGGGISAAVLITKFIIDEYR
ncbi:MAG: hypothetical protein ACLFM7_08145 [Bacteroidales bacterium]